jgi:integrase
MSDIEDEDIEEFYYSLPKTISTKTKLNIINALKAFFNSYRITRKKNLEFPSPIPNDPAWQWIEEDTQDLIISKIPEQNKPAFLFMKYHLTRQGETRALMNDCVDLKKGIVTIKRNFSNEVLTEVTKGRKDCSIPIDPDFMPIMERLCKEIPPFKNDFIFRVQRGKRKGQYFARNTLRKIWNKAEKDAGVPHIQLHWGTRNSGASQLLEAGASLKDIQELLRHADLKTTDKAYAHYQRKRLIKIMQLRKKKNHLRVVK